MFQIRTTKPQNNKYYITTSAGGWSYAIKGKPTDPNANVLSNCVGYANGRFAEIQDLGKIKYQLVCNAENMIERAKSLGLQISTVPVAGGMMVWQKGSLSSGDGAGHVAIVERVIDQNTIYTSESNYGGIAFLNATRRNTNGRWGLGSAYSYRGCIVNPAVGNYAVHSVDQNESVHQIYVGLDNLNVRTGAGISYSRLGYAERGYYNVLSTKINDYVWFEVETGKWCAGVSGVQDLPAVKHMYSVYIPSVSTGDMKAISSLCDKLQIEYEVKEL